MNHLAYLIEAYAVVWIGTLLYVATVMQRQREVIKELKGILEKKS